MANPRPYNLAIETAGRTGAIALGKDDELLEAAPLPRKRRHNIELVPMIDSLCRTHGASPATLGAIYVSLGPGSFTGLRIGIATAKMLAFASEGSAKLVGVPTLDVLAQNAPADPGASLAVCLNLKRETCHSGRFTHDGTAWRPAGEQRLRSMAELVEEMPRPLMLLGDPLPELPGGAAGVTVLDPKLAEPRAEAVWRLGREREVAGEFTDPASLLPLYIREPEAVTLWEARHGKGK